MISSDREITEEDLMDCSSFELSAVRNGIYAVHGYIFQTQEWNDYFSDFDWYRPNPDFKQNQISGTESKNASFIRGYEEEIYGGIYSFWKSCKILLMTKRIVIHNEIQNQTMCIMTLRGNNK